jgi:cytochrome c oxidase subunit 2
MPLFSKIIPRICRLLPLFLLVALCAVPISAFADTAIGAPHAWGIDLQTPYSPVKHRMHDFHDMLLVIISVISAFVLLLLIYVIVRYNAHANPQPKKFAHNTMIEVIWTAIPVIILVVIGIPSMKLLYYLDKAHNPEMTLKVTGHQWYWSYEYPDQKIESFDSRPIWDGTQQKPEQIQAALREASAAWLVPTPNPLRLLEVDNRIVLPVDTEVRVYITAADVIHSWSEPALGVKLDAVPGKLNETWLKIEKEGVYYGQCSQLCGMAHAYMPIVIEAVSKEKFAEWVKTKAAPVEEVKPADAKKEPAKTNIHTKAPAASAPAAAEPAKK